MATATTVPSRTAARTTTDPAHTASAATGGACPVSQDAETSHGTGSPVRRNWAIAAAREPSGTARSNRSNVAVTGSVTSAGSSS